MLVTGDSSLAVERNAPIPTWFGVGGCAERMARPASAQEVCMCLDLDPMARVLGDGANLLVDDDGVGELVIALTHKDMQAVKWGEGREAGRVWAMAGANLPKLITEAVRRGLGGIEGLGGIPASVGGAVMMNAGGAFGQIGDVVQSVSGATRGGRRVTLVRGHIDFEYRSSGLQGMIITEVEMRLTPGDPEAIRSKLLEVMAYKKRTQPMAERSAGCCFKNPTVEVQRAMAEGWANSEAKRSGPGSRPTHCRVSAGMLIDRAGCKGMRVGGAEVSESHANFFVVREGATARNVIELMEQVTQKVEERFGVMLEREVVVWRREESGRGVALPRSSS
jgi:UDP-N-acetylmuramate dehydrogenase